MMLLIIRFVTDISIIACSYLLAYMIRFNLISFNDVLALSIQRYFNYIIVVLLIYYLSFYFLSMYKSRKGFLVEVDELLAVFSSVSLAWVTLIVLTFVRGEYEYSRPIIILVWPISFVLMAIARMIVLRFDLWLRANGHGTKRAAIIGTNDLARSLAEKIKANPSYGIDLVGFIGDSETGVLGRFENLAKLVSVHKLKALYIADKSINRQNLAELAAFCDQLGIVLGMIPDVFEIITTSPAVEDVEGVPIISLKQTRFTLANRFVKRTFDLLLSAFGILIFSLPMMIIAALVKLTSPGDCAVYQQERVGRDGSIFNVYKFRTMIPDAESKTGPVLSSDDDPRKTKFGKFLRKTNLDELPQLFNILRGNMSFVGPRPERPVFVDQFKGLIPKYMDRHHIKPGLAGWAQLHGGYSMPAGEKIKYDLYYIENWSMLLDIKIILKYIHIAFTGQRKN